MKSEKQTHLSKLRKRMRIVGILMLISVVLVYLWYLYMSLPTNPPTGLFTPMPVIYSFFFHSLSLLCIVVGIKLIRGKCLNLGKYLSFVLILEIFLVVWAIVSIWELGFVPFPVDLGESLSVLLAILPLILPIIAYKFFKDAVSNSEYKKTFIQESKFQKISFLVLVLLFIIGGAICIYRDFLFMAYFSSPY